MSEPIDEPLKPNPYIFAEAYPHEKNDLTDYNSEEAYELGVSAGWDSQKALIQRKEDEAREDELKRLLPEGATLPSDEMENHLRFIIHDRLAELHRHSGETKE